MGGSAGVCEFIETAEAGRPVGGLRAERSDISHLTVFEASGLMLHQRAPVSCRALVCDDVLRFVPVAPMCGHTSAEGDTYGSVEYLGYGNVEYRSYCCAGRSCGCAADHQEEAAELVPSSADQLCTGEQVTPRRGGRFGCEGPKPPRAPAELPKLGNRSRR